MPPDGAILFTAFEPSGDILAARMVGLLRAVRPDIETYGLGGSQMENAGATLIERTADQAVMLDNAIAMIAEHRRRMRRLEHWMREHPLSLVVPVDSPAANWGVCEMTRKLHPDTPVVHLAAPQLWAWAPWRIKKMRRLSDHVLCLLPFEQSWFESRGMPATYVSHPLFDPQFAPVSFDTSTLPDDDGPRLALLPGSREAEVAGNLPPMLEAARRLKRRHKGMRTVIAAANPPRAEQIETMRAKLDEAGELVDGMLTARTNDVLHWASAALAVTGTVTLQVTAHRVPMVGVFHVPWWKWWLAGRWVVRTRSFAMPNIISDSLGLGRVVPELVPFYGDASSVERTFEPVMVDETVRAKQREGFEAIVEALSHTRFGDAASAVMLDFIDNGRRQ